MSDKNLNLILNETEVLVLGAGAAGLAAAANLSEHGITVRVLEARDRIGGRIFTKRDPIEGFPMELGAEFIHGKPKVTLELVKAGQLTYYDALDSHFTRLNGRLEPLGSYWDRLEELMAKLDGDRNPDRSFAEFLQAHESEIDPQTKDLIAAFIQGFHAADPNEISERGLAASEQATSEDDSGAGDAAHNFKIVEGYDRLIQVLAHRIHDVDHALLLNRVVHSIRWSKGKVEVEAHNKLTGTNEIHRASRLIVTLPLGVLQARLGDEGYVQFDPMPEPLKEAMKALRMGSALRISLRFKDRFWEDGVEDPIGFLHGSAKAHFPIWWTPLPARRNFITAWTGGPKAKQLAEQPLSQLIDTAVSDLSDILSRDPHFVRSQLLSVAYHDWAHDPYSRGAYSYIAVGGKEAAEAFALPVDDTLYFAGEATHMGEERGTVSGALATGERAAKLIIESR